MALKRLVPLLVLAAVILTVIPLSGAVDIVTERRITLALVNIVAVVGLYIFMGNSGVLTFSAVGFMAVGAYTSALTTMPPMMKSTFLPDLPLWLSVAEISPVAGAFAGGTVAAVVALVAGAPLMRLSGIGASIATLSLLIIAYIVLGNWTSLTGGQTSLMGLPRHVDLTSAAIWAVGAVALAFAYQETRWALALRAAREDEVAARASGIRIVPLRLIAFVLSAFVSGIAGALYVHYLGTARIELFYLDATFLFLTMLVVGGMRSFTGAVVGTVVISALTEAMRLLEVGVAVPGTTFTLATAPGLGDVALAAVMLLILVFRPRGITGGREIGWR
ncbi:MAG: branched-chain amino acid ABC transporter permease [Pseudomonadota bacterium]